MLPNVTQGLELGQSVECWASWICTVHRKLSAEISRVEMGIACSTYRRNGYCILVMVW